MFVGHKMELMVLQEYYKRPGNPVLLVHGRKGIGKTTLVKEFIKEHPHFYYLGADCCEKEQLRLLQQIWREKSGYEPLPDNIPSVLNDVLNESDLGQKFVLVLDECDRIIKNSDTFVDEFIKMLKNVVGKSRFMVLLLTSDTMAVEDKKNQKMQQLLSVVTRQIPLKEYQFSDIVSYFQGCSTEHNIMVYGILGGIPDYLRLWNGKEDVRSNVIRLLLRQDGELRNEAGQYLRQYLRELSSYNSVLAAMADGNIRLNDLYARTGFSRAKVSVYIKNLIQIGVARKITVYGPEKKDAMLKGLYEITDPFLHFWYRFVFPNETALEQGRAEWVYDTKIAPCLQEYMGTCFVRVCEQFMHLMNRFGKLPVSVSSLNPWYGEQGSIPMMATDEEGHLVTCFCKWSEETFDEKSLEEELRYLLVTGFEPDYYFLFSKSGFSRQLKEKADLVSSIMLVDLNDF